MKLPTPQDIGLPEKYSTWRPRQEDALHFLRTRTKRVRSLSMPTGSGKFGVVFADAMMSGQPTAYVTESRALQDQALQECQAVGAVDLRGKSNYECPLKDGYSCLDGQAAKCPLKGTVQCAASFAEMRAAASHFVITNYDKWIHTRKFGQGLAHIKRVIFDEGHEAHNALARAMQVVLSTYDIEKVLKMDFPPEHESEFFSTWKVWANQAKAICDQSLVDARNRLAVSDPKPSWVRQFTHLRNLNRKLSILALANPNNWVVEEIANNRGFQFDPIRPARYAESSLLLNVPEIVIVSATLRPKLLYMIGIGKEHFDFVEYKSDFDPKRCPCYYVPTMRVDSKALDLAMLWIRLDQIAAPRQDRNGLVHSVSFGRAEEIKRRSRFGPHMFINERGEPATWMIEQFKSAYPGAILVSPSVGQGFDFAGKAAEWQFIAKLPFPPPSKILEARKHEDAEYPYVITMQKLVQMVGRLMRSYNDQGETIISDDHLRWFFPRYRHLAPPSFTQFFQEVATLPPPPPRLM